MKIIKYLRSLFGRKPKVHDYRKPQFSYDLATKLGDAKADLFGSGEDVRQGDILILDAGRRNRFLVEKIEYLANSTWKAKVKRL